MNNEERLRLWLEEAGCQQIRLGAGDNLVCTCPFHEVESGTQFSISAVTGAYCCFSGRCGAVGNIVTFLVQALGWSFKKAIWASEQFKFLIDFSEDKQIPFEERKKHLRPEREKIVEEATLGLYDFCPRYLLDRGFSKEALRRWEIGYDVDTRRVTIPVRNELGQLVGFSKRGTKNHHQPKYLHLDFPKGAYLYGLCFLHVGYRRRPVWITEGQLDTLALDQMGKASVSTMGTRISDEQVNLMAKFRKVVLAFDNPEVDQDGRKTTMAIGERLLEKMERGSVLVPVYPKGAKDSADVLQKKLATRRRFLASPVAFEDWRLVA